MMTDLYIATSTQAGHDALMRLAESAGYKWHDDALPTVCNLCDYVEEEENVVHLYDDFQEGRRMAQDDRAYYESQNVTIETIPNLAKIKAIWKVSRENRDAFTMKHRLPPHYKSARKLYVICDEYSGTYTTKENEIYEALAVEYKPEKSEDIMPKKVKLPRNVIDTFRPALDSPGYRRLGSLTPIRIISDMYNRTLEGMTNDVSAWLNDYDNQWKLIDALRYGYEPEPEQLYYVRFTGNNGDFLNLNTETGKVFTGGHQEIYEYKAQFTMPEIIAIDPRYKAFAVPVDEVDGDMNKEGEADD